jgi:hypothetical protein
MPPQERQSLHSKSPEPIGRTPPSSTLSDVFRGDWRGASSSVGLPFNEEIQRQNSGFEDPDNRGEQLPSDEAAAVLLSFFYTELAPFLHAETFSHRPPPSSRHTESLLDAVALTAAALHHPSPALSALYPSCRDRLKTRYMELLRPQEYSRKSQAELLAKEVDDVKGICAAVAFLCDDGGQGGEWRRLIGVGKALSQAWQALPAHLFDSGTAEREAVATLLHVRMGGSSISSFLSC